MPLLLLSICPMTKLEGKQSACSHWQSLLIQKFLLGQQQKHSFFLSPHLEHKSDTVPKRWRSTSLEIKLYFGQSSIGPTNELFKF